MRCCPDCSWALASYWDWVRKTLDSKLRIFLSGQQYFFWQVKVHYMQYNLSLFADWTRGEWGGKKACLYAMSLVSGQVSLNEPKVRLKVLRTSEADQIKAGFALGFMEALFEVPSHFLKLETKVKTENNLKMALKCLGLGMCHIWTDTVLISGIWTSAVKTPKFSISVLSI